MFLRIDDWFFDKVFQPISDWFVDRTGRSPHWLAATCAYMYAASVLIEQYYIPSETWLDMAFEAFVFLFAILIALRNDSDDKRKSGSVGTTLNSMRVSPLFQFLRIVGWPVIIFNISDVFRNDTETNQDLFRCFQSSLFSCLLYFEACETKPPAPPKKKEISKPALSAS